MRYLPGAREFLASVRARGKHLWIVTNAHRDTLAVKMEQTGIDRLVDRVVSSHDLRAPKESAEFWRGLERRIRSTAAARSYRGQLAVLAPAAHGVAYTVAIRRPDSRLPPRTIDAFVAVDSVADLV